MVKPIWSKSEGLMLKGNLEHGFTIQFGTERIRTKNKVKYLGLLIDQGFEFKSNPEIIGQKNTTEFSRMRGMMGNDWGVTFNTDPVL